jgi:hypothetical protein
MSVTVYRISGVDPNPDARDVFVWYHSKVTGEYTLLGTGRIVGAGSSSAPPGILTGQYTVTASLASDLSPSNICVTDDKSGQEFLSDFTVSPGFISGNDRSAGTIGLTPPVSNTKSRNDIGFKK